jgi:protein tyrosine phosphatase (PTP) superfamily phosphohydrolase (DUF442 family)
MEKRTYKAPVGATSITVSGKTYDVDGKGNLQCDDDSVHDVLLSHGFTYGDAPVVPTTYSADDLARMKAALEERAAQLQADFEARDQSLTDYRITLDKFDNELKDREAALNARAADLGNRETALVMREAALAAAAPPPPPAPPADAKPSKAK